MNNLFMYVIYNNTRDYPGLYVVRKWEILPGETKARELLGTASTLNGIRRFVPAGLTRLERSPDDDDKIVEIWL